MQTRFIVTLAVAITSCHQGTQKGTIDPSVSKPLTVIPIRPEDAPKVMMGSPFNSLNNEHASGFSGESAPGCIIADELGTIGGVVNGLETYQITTVTSQEEFFRQLDINYKAKTSSLVNMISFKGGQDLKTMSSIRINKNYSYALVSAKKLWQARQIKKASVNPEIMTIIREDPTKFFSLCGDEYLSSINLVTEAYGMLECKTESREEKRKIDLILESSVGVKDVGGIDTTFQATVDQIAKKTNGKCQLYVWQRGGKGTISDKPETFGTSVANYVANASFDNAAITDLGTTQYKKAVVNAELWKIVQGIDLDFKVPRSVIRMWQLELEVITDRMQKILDVIDNEPDPKKDAELYIKADEYVKTVAIVEANIKRCAERPDLYEACRDSRNTEDPWPNPDDPIIED